LQAFRSYAGRDQAAGRLPPGTILKGRQQRLREFKLGEERSQRFDAFEIKQ
jgi:hypothetical protein